MGAGFLQWGAGGPAAWAVGRARPLTQGSVAAWVPQEQERGQLFSWDFAAFSGPCGMGPAQPTMARGWRRKAGQIPDMLDYAPAGPRAGP